MINIIIFIIISFVYNGYIIYKYGIPVSLSDTSYLLGGKKRFWFTGYCYATAFLIMPILMKVVPEIISFLPFLMCTGLLFSGASPFFKEGLDKPVHYVFSMISFISFLIFMILEMGWVVVLSFCLLLGLTILLKPNCYVYFAEILSFIFIIIYLL